MMQKVRIFIITAAILMGAVIGVAQTLEPAPVPMQAATPALVPDAKQQAEMAAMLTRRFGGDPRVAYVNLGPVIEVADPALSFDRMHLTAAGNARLGDALLSPVMTMAAGRSTAGAPTEH
jgi:hypothetical protein